MTKLALASLVLAAALWPAALQAEPAFPAGWRALTAQETAELRRQAHRGIGQPANQEFAIAADFDGDGRTDRALFLVNKDQGKFGLFVLRAKAGRYERLDYGHDLAGLWNYGLEVEPPGVFKTACAKGYGDPCGKARAEVRTRWPSIGAFAFESSSAIFFWDGKKFDSEYLSD